MRTVYRVLYVLLMLLYGGYELAADEYRGVVVDEKGRPVLYATVYMQARPQEGTATNSEGIFYLTTDMDTTAEVVVSYIGYEKVILPLGRLTSAEKSSSPYEIRLKEQPIALQETVVSAKRTRMSKRKQLAMVLHRVYQQIGRDFPSEPIEYKVVSDIRMNASSSPWAMEQMIAEVTEQPGGGKEGTDSVQFVGKYCKRYCSPAVRTKLDTLQVHEKDERLRKLATRIDSGALTHQVMWRMRVDKTHLLDVSDELARWKMTAEDDDNCVLTYRRKYNYLGIVKLQLEENLIVDAYSYRLRSYVVDVNVQLFLPFSVKMQGTWLEWLNLLNMDSQGIEKFRLKRGNIHVKLNTIYKERDGVLVPDEKNLHTTGVLEDRSGRQLPLELWGTQQVTDVRITGVKLHPKYNRNRIVTRELVEIY